MVTVYINDKLNNDGFLIAYPWPLSDFSQPGTFPSEHFEYNGRAVLIQESITTHFIGDTERKDSHVNVFGYVIDEGVKDKNQCRAVEVEPIPHHERKELSNLLMKRFPQYDRRHIRF